MFLTKFAPIFKFQSTPSVGRATAPRRYRNIRGSKFQSTPSVGRATFHCLNLSRCMTFQSTPSVGRATYCCRCALGYKVISIHALRGEGDDLEIAFNCKPYNFNPRPPWGGRQNQNVRTL